MATSQRRADPVPRSRGAPGRRASTGEADGPAPVDVRCLVPLIAPGGAATAQPADHGRRSVNAAAVIALQQAHGNAHVARMLDRARATAGPSPAVQRDAAPAARQSINFLTARWRIRLASAGAGTKEGEIYEAIRLCAEADRATLKADPEVQRLLKSEMKGHDLWKAQLLLEFGTESRFPPTVRAIWGATEGVGTDEQRIYKAIDKLTPGQLDELLKIPGLRGILKADLNKGAMKRATGGAGILGRHRRNVEVTKEVLAEMKKPDRSLLIRNTAELLEPSGGGASKARLSVLTKTHDAADRAKKHGKTGEVAYFGDDQTYPDNTADYDLDITEDRNIHFEEPGVAGSQIGSRIRLMEPRRRRASVPSTLVHEVQHLADKHERDPDWHEDDKSPEQSWVLYKTEFRAYWIDGSYKKHGTTSGTANEARFDNAKQEAIFLHLWGDNDKDTYAEWLRPNYRGNTAVGGRKFRDLVHGYTHPEGVNLINSPRIDHFWRRLRLCDKGDTILGLSPLKELKAAAQALDDIDRTYVQSSRAAALQQMMKDRLAAKPLEEIAKILNGGTLPDWAR